MTVINLKNQKNIPVHTGQGVGVVVGGLQEEINRLFNDFLGFVPSLSVARSAATANLSLIPAVDLAENDKNYLVHVELPGVQANDVYITAGDGYLTLKGERKQQTEHKQDNTLRREFIYGSFQRSISLPQAADTNAAQAEFKNGVLTITIPKKADETSKTRKITVKAAA